jgi:hypothetical protein
MGNTLVVPLPSIVKNAKDSSFKHIHPYQNGVFQRKNQTIFEKAKSILLESG